MSMARHDPIIFVPVQNVNYNLKIKIEKWKFYLIILNIIIS